ncbi:hypothetical protein J22TS3_19830 [Paenibacillus sp. J22TS3]|nr:hypothetical protein J22TS3_19830 [Paenibacillus sp. J22TS3]
MLLPALLVLDFLNYFQWMKSKIKGDRYRLAAGRSSLRGFGEIPHQKTNKKNQNKPFLGKPGG